MSESSLTPGESCECVVPEIDKLGNVLLLQTCPICMAAALDNVRGVEYSVSYENGVRRRVQQQELFRFTPYSRSGQREVIPNGE